MMMKTKHLLLLLSVLLLSLVEGSTDIDYSEQRRQLMWGSGGFAWLMYTMHLCGGPGPLCPPPPCHMIGPGHHPPPHWHCTQVSSSTSSEETTSVDTSYYEYKEDDGDSSGSSASGSSGFMWFNALMYLVGAAALASIVGFIVFKKRRAETESNIEGSVARRMELLEKGQLETPPEPAPPTFIELPASATSGVSPSTNYVNM